MKKNIIFIALLSSGFGLIGCNTIDGVGKDFEEAGESVQEAAN
jgi:predicted small secreted protein